MWLYWLSSVPTTSCAPAERQVVTTPRHTSHHGCDSLDMRGMRCGLTSDSWKTVTLDVTKTESISCRLWGLVNNAGITLAWAPNQCLTKRDFVTILDVNLLGVIEVTLSLLSLVRKARGRVVNVSSIGGRVSIIGGGDSISKYGIEAFSDSLRRELAPFGVKVAIIEPSFFKTNMTNTERVLLQVQEVWDRAPPEIKEIYGEKCLASYVKLLSEHILPKCNENLSEVMDYMEHALTACHPRTRYSAGWDAKLLYLPMSYMPTFLVDAIVTWGLPRPAKAL
uniref:Uncharacterized protein n=1 Tax=Microcebus murinus TaxID=30608 RepID=A0A8C6EJJ1_MICMU